MISGKTTLLAQLGFPHRRVQGTHDLNSYFEDARIDAVVVPTGVQAVVGSGSVGSAIAASLAGASVSRSGSTTSTGLRPRP